MARRRKASTTPARPRTGAPGEREAFQTRQRRAAGAESERKPLGRSGTVNSDGYITDAETQFALRWPEAGNTYEEMRRTDPTIRNMEMLVSTPIRAADWSMEAASDEEQDLEVAAFVEQALFHELDGGWDDFLRRVLDNWLGFGHGVFERIADLREVEFSYTVPEPGPESREAIIKREAFVISRLGQRLPRTIQRWVAEERDSSRLKEIEQWLGDGREPATVTIPAQRLVVFTLDQEGDDWRGISLLRTAYWPYMKKLRLEQLEAIAYERSTGLPVFYPPENASPEQLDALEAMGRSIRQGEALYAVMPGPKSTDLQEGTEGWLVEDLHITGDANRSPNDAINRYDGQIARNVLAEFMRLGHENVGARATGDVQQDPYYQAVEACVRYLETVINGDIVRPLVDWNYEVTRYPTIRASKIQAKNVQVIGQVVAQLLEKQGITPDADLEGALRELLDLPPKRVVEEQEEEEPAVPAPPIAPAPPSSNGEAPPEESETPPGVLEVTEPAGFASVPAPADALEREIAATLTASVDDAARRLDDLRLDTASG